MTIVTDSPALDQLTESELIECLRAGAIDGEAFGAEVARREDAARRSDRARAAARVRNAEWEAAAYAQWQAAEDYCHGYLLSEAGKRAGRDAWPMLWHGSEETARGLASEDMIRFWDYIQPRVPGPGQYAAAKRAAAAEHAARASDAPVTRQATPSARELAEHAAATAAATPPAAATPARPPGSIARYITKLNELTAALDRTHRAMARVNGGIR